MSPGREDGKSMMFIWKKYITNLILTKFSVRHACDGGPRAPRFNVVGCLLGAFEATYA